MKIGAVIVSFNPDLVTLKENIDAVVDQISGVVIVDNGSISVNDIEELVSANEKIQIIKNNIISVRLH